MRRLALVLLVPILLVPGLVAGGCGGQTTSGFSAAGKEASCAELCEQSAECDSNVDVTACTETCAESEVVSRAGQDLLTDCSADLDCGAAAGLETLACLEDGLFDLPINEAQEDFCTITLGRLAECGESPLSEDDVDNCLAGVALLSEEFVTELGECGERTTCSLVNLCAGLELLTALDEEQLEVILGSGVGTGAGLGSLEDLLGSLDGSMGGAGPG
jgi:hypothetical protein